MMEHFVSLPAAAAAHSKHTRNERTIYKYVHVVLRRFNASNVVTIGPKTDATAATVSICYKYAQSIHFQFVTY